MYEREKKHITNELEIYIDLNERSLAVNLMIQEFLEINWNKYFSKVKMFINNAVLPEIELPNTIEICATESKDYFSEVKVFYNWYLKKKNSYLVTITGDGEYRFGDIISSIEILEHSKFGVVYGSRVQSRQQYLNSLDSVYGESKFLFFLSRLGGFAIGILCILRYRIFFSDPITGFRAYSRKMLKNRLKTLDPKKVLSTPMELTRHIIKSRIEIAEIPVQYRTYKGFTNIKWRLTRGLKNIFRIFL